MTDKELLDNANALARLFYESFGYVVPKGYAFHKATHPQEKGMWNLAHIAFEELTETDLNSVLSGIEDEDESP